MYEICNLIFSLKKYMYILCARKHLFLYVLWFLAAHVIPGVRSLLSMTPKSIWIGGEKHFWVPTIGSEFRSLLRSNSYKTIFDDFFAHLPIFLYTDLNRTRLITNAYITYPPWRVQLIYVYHSIFIYNNEFVWHLFLFSSKVTLNTHIDKI